MRSRIALAAAAFGGAALLYLYRSRRGKSGGDGADNAQPEAAAITTAPAPAVAPAPTAASPPEDLYILHSGDFAAEVATMVSKAVAKKHPATTCHIVVMDTFKREDAGACIRFFNRRTHAADLLEGKLHYAVLGLGDSNLLLDRQTTTAKDCNQIARRLDARLAALGGTRAHAVGECDDRTGNLELEPWMKAYVDAL